jgi:UDP-N-acetyl-D-glucosamine dehydrogenase
VSENNQNSGNTFQTLINKLNDCKSMQLIAVVGLGYVGLPLSLQFARSGVSVIGLDIDQAKVDSLNNRSSYIRHIASESIATEIDGGRFQASTDFAKVSSVDAVIICVPTPLNKNREPDISYIIETGRNISRFLRSGQLVILESTTYPGTTDEDLRAVLEEGSGLKAGIDFHLAFSPEREDPGNPQSLVANIPKVIGGLTPACLKKASDLYGCAIKTLVPVSSCRAAEATKLLENIFRSVNIALVNELKVVYSSMGIDIWEVISAAKTKPFGYMAFYPGPGLGGHCIPIDPFYLTWKAREHGLATRFIELAGEINTSMPEWVIQKVTSALNSVRKPVNGSRILVVGLAYKADVDDMRESPTFTLLDKLKSMGANVQYYDPYIPVVTPTREHSSWTGVGSVSWSEENIKSFDCVLISTAHKCVNYRQLLEWSQLIVDTRNAVNPSELHASKVYKA